MDDFYVPPHSVEAEQSVIGGLLLDNGAWDEVSTMVRETDFYRREHQLIFRAIRRRMEKQEPADVVTVHDFLKTANSSDDVGGLPYIGELAKNTPSAANVTTYAKVVRDKSARRRLIAACNELSREAMEAEDTAELLETAQKRVFDLAQNGGTNGFKPLKDFIIQNVEQIDQLFNHGTGLTGLATGFPDLDRILLGLQDSDLIILAARPSMGKTALALQIAQHAALDGHSVAFFSLEMSGTAVSMRNLSSVGRIDLQVLRSGQLRDEDWLNLTTAIAELDEKPLHIDDTGGLTSAEVRARARRLARELGGRLDLIVVDYLQLMASSGDTRNEEVSEISRSLKALAKEMNCPVIALSQLNRKLEERPDKRPKPSDLRDSGAIEQDADVIVFLYRDEVYDPNSQDAGTAEIIVSKQRQGPTGTVRLSFLKRLARFESFVTDAGDA